MSDKAEKKPEAAPPAPAKEAEKKEGGEKKKGGGLLSKTPVLLGIVMVLEAVVLFAGVKFLGSGPQAAVAIDLKEGEKASHGDKTDAHGGAEKKPGPKEKTVEVPVLDFKAPNTQNGRRYIYDVNVFATVNADSSDKVKEKIKANDALIRTRIRTIIAQMDPDKLGGGSEPGLETLSRQIKAQLEIIIGDGMIDEVLVPRCIPFRADF